MFALYTKLLENAVKIKANNNETIQDSLEEGYMMKTKFIAEEVNQLWKLTFKMLVD